MKPGHYKGDLLCVCLMTVTTPQRLQNHHLAQDCGNLPQRIYLQGHLSSNISSSDRHHLVIDPCGQGPLFENNLHYPPHYAFKVFLSAVPLDCVTSVPCTASLPAYHQLNVTILSNFSMAV
jgi:hypothetical protein